MYFACKIVKYETRLILPLHHIHNRIFLIDSDAVEECLRAHMDTFPFPNARFALLYLLLHSPRPVVSSEESIIIKS